MKCFAPKTSLIYAAQFCSTADVAADVMNMLRGASDERLIFNMDQDGFNFTKDGIDYHVPPRGWLIVQQDAPGYSVLTEEEFREKYSCMSDAPTGAPMDVKMSALDLAIRTSQGGSACQVVDMAKEYATFLMTGK